MRQSVLPTDFGDGLVERLTTHRGVLPRQAAIGAILVIALFAFEMFNFDTTRYALRNLLGPVSFLGIGWASILAVAFCSIDFAGLVHLFTPESDGEQPKEVWYLMGAWLLGATMNALMTWWAVSLTLLNHDFGNEVLSREQLLQVVPIFVAVLVWLTRILFIGALTVAGEQLLEWGASEGSSAKARSADRPRPMGQPMRARPAPAVAGARMAMQGFSPTTDEVPAFVNRRRSAQAPAANRNADTVVAATIPQLEIEHDGEERSEQAVQPITLNEKKRKPHRQTTRRQGRTHRQESTRREEKPRPNGRVRQRPPVPGRTAGIRASGRNKRV
ncbi:MAG: hypothetical protein R3272_07100 [Candidatus Promineifilaceae bacterium]|nr:hypothetical protein [Candidatus Promineifilaceae bacterium]